VIDGGNVRTPVESHRANHVQDIAPRLWPRLRPLRRRAVASAVPVLRQPGPGTLDGPSLHPQRGTPLRSQPDFRHAGLQRVAGCSGLARHLPRHRGAARGHRRPTGVQHVRLSGDFRLRILEPITFLPFLPLAIRDSRYLLFARSADREFKRHRVAFYVVGRESERERKRESLRQMTCDDEIISDLLADLRF